MKYFVWISQETQYNDYTDEIIDFFWNNGNEVYISSNYQKTSYEQIIQKCDCIVLLDFRDVCFTKITSEFIDNVFIGNGQNNYLVFSNKGVYTSLIPSPYKIFHFNTLSKRNLSHFFIWCNRLQLFK